jgi:PIN domain nuclease of toxin-antitoxin system
LTGLLVDTHVLLWWRGDYRRIAPTARGALEDPDVEVLYSAASIWEMAIKRAAGKLNMPPSLPETMGERGFRELPVRAVHGLIAGGLPRLHADPFDRMLVAQAKVENLTLVTGDARLSAYDVRVLW